MQDREKSEGKFDTSYLEELGFEEGVTSKTVRTEMRYYTEEDEKNNCRHIKDQMASYHEVRSSVEGKFSDSPALESEVYWYGADYDWVFKHEDDRELVYKTGVSEEYIEDFQRTEVEKEQKRSVPLITGYKEHTTDNIGHDSSREWSTFVGGGKSDDGSFHGESGYDKYGRVLEFRESSVSVEGTNEMERYDIEYWGREIFQDPDVPEEETEYGRWFVENADLKQKRWSYGQIKRYQESSHFSGAYARTATNDRITTCYDGYGRLLTYEEHSTVDGVGYGIHFDVLSYRDEGWVSNLMTEYMEERTSEEVKTVTKHSNQSWDKYGQVLCYNEIVESRKFNL